MTPHPSGRLIDAFSSSGLVEVYQVPRRHVLWREGEPPGFVGVITRGHIELCRHRARRRVILTLLGAGDSVGEVPGLGGMPASWDAVATGETTVLAVAPSELQLRLRNNQNLACQWAVATSRQAMELYDRLSELLIGDLHARIAALLIRLSAGADYVDITQQTLAGMLGAERTSVNRTLGGMQAEGLVTVHRGRVQISDNSALNSLSKDEAA